MDHLAPPLALEQPMYEAMATAGWVPPRTETLRVGHLVLCDAFRHPAVLARRRSRSTTPRAAASSSASGGARCPRSSRRSASGDRAARRGSPGSPSRSTSCEGCGRASRRLRRRAPPPRRRPATPRPVGAIPIVIGGAGPSTMAPRRPARRLVERPVHALDRLDELRDGRATPGCRCSVVALVPADAPGRGQPRPSTASGPRWVGASSPAPPRAGRALRHARPEGSTLLRLFADFGTVETLERLSEVIAATR